MAEAKTGELSEAEVMFDWNNIDTHRPLGFRKDLKFHDETLRDGIQSPSTTDPRIEDKMELVRLASQLGVTSINVGLPGAGPRAVADCTRLVELIRDEKLPIKPACAARTHPNDIRPVIEISQRTGVEIEVMAFIGSSPIRVYAEGWDTERLLKLSSEAIRMAVGAGLPCTYVTEDTTRSRPEVLHRLFASAIEAGAHRLCLCDTTGYITPDGVRSLMRWVRYFLAGLGTPHIGIDWHGHNDRGLGVTNTLYAAEFGADRIHGTALGIGERVGNAALDQVLMNLKLLGALPREHDLSRLVEWCELAARACNVPIPFSYPLVGRDAFRTATGVHAAAIIKAETKGDAWLADRIYSGVPAGMFGREQQIEVGYYSGESNVVYWLRKRDISPEPELVKYILTAAKSGDHILSETEIFQLVSEHNSERRAGHKSAGQAGG